MSPPKTPASQPLADALLGEFCELLGARTGLQVRDKDRGTLARALEERCEAQRLDLAGYLQKLRLAEVDGPEWKLLMPQLTNGESYFERDKGQFALIRDTILPELIEQKRATNERTLRIWSAGCSTGEEVYSLAIAAEAVLPSGWKAMILGTDINALALQKARRGVYGEWSFRGVEAATRDRHFHKVGENYEVVAQLRGRVTFGFCNLSASDWPDARRGIADMDLIVCRNVLIYFRRAVVAGVLSRFTRTLRAGGFLLTGHAELHDQNVAPLKSRFFSASAAYQKEISAHGTVSGATTPSFARIPNATLKPAFKPLPPLATTGTASTTMGTSDFVSTARTEGAAELRPPRPAFLASPTAPASKPKVASESETKTAEEWCAAAKSLADSGRYDEAIASCREVIKLDSAHTDTYLLWAHIAEELGQANETKELLKKVIYLAPMRAESYVELAAIYEREGNGARARQMRVSALKLLHAQTTGKAAITSNAPAALLRHIQTLVKGDDETMPSPGERR